jgi:competence ComEA-like helix-hairpin-helix protein
MKARLKSFIESLNFTATERIVVLTLVGAFILGLGIRLFRQDATGSPGFDYAASDAEFTARSSARALPSTPARAADTVTAPAAAGAPGAARSAGAGVRVDLNRASKRDLMGLPGVGEVIAERILLYREEHGGFAGVADLMKVKGIGKKKLEQIAPHCFVEK